MIAKDGKPYDIVNPSVSGHLKSNEVEIIQYMRFDGTYFGGERRRLVAELDEKTARKADSLIITGFIHGINQVTLCARKVGESEDKAICVTSENDRVNIETGNNLLKKLINDVMKVKK